MYALLGDGESSKCVQMRTWGGGILHVYVRTIVCYTYNYYIHFVLLNLMQRFLKNHQGKGDFSVQKVGIFFQS